MIPPVQRRSTQNTQNPQSTASFRKRFALRPSRSLRSLFLLALLLRPPATIAHDLEKTQVLIAFERDGSFTVDVANDPVWLTLRLESIRGPFADRVVLWVDGHEIRPA